jgi:Tetratricopeptide repeat
VTQDEEWLEALRAQRPASTDLAHATLARIFSALDRRASLHRVARITAGGLVGALACAALAQQLSRPALHVAPSERARDSGAHPSLDVTGPLRVESEAPSSAPRDGTAAPAPPRRRRATVKQTERAAQGIEARGSAREPEQHAPALVPASPADPAPAAASALPETRLRASYETAHRLQFAGNPEAALRAWDAFLASQASGPLAVEARYYRALSLLRLGRREAARAALLPFARGDYGDFRRHDAARWLSQLDAARLRE